MCPRSSVAVEQASRVISRAWACAAVAGVLAGCLPSSGDLGAYSADWSPQGDAPAQQMTLPNQLAPASGTAAPDTANAPFGAASGANADASGAASSPSANPPSSNSEQSPTPVAPVPSAQATGQPSTSPTAADVPPSSEPSPSAAQQCPDGVLDAAKASCYLVATVRATWQVARGACTTWGGALVKVESAQEDQLLGQLVTEDMWLGASDTAIDNVFVWTDGSPILFGNWGPAQPDGFPGPDCIQKRSTGARQWFDQPCDNAWLYVCEKPIRP